MRSAKQKPEVVYRRMPPPGSAETPTGSLDSGRRNIAPAIIFLITGFVLLLGLISTVGIRSVKLMDEIGNRGREVKIQRTALINLLWELRLKVTRLDTEARLPGKTEGRAPDLTPPFEVRLNTARGEVAEVTKRLDTPPLAGQTEWQTLRQDLETYIQGTLYLRDYSLNGYKRFHIVEEDLDRLFAKVQSQDDEVVQAVIA